MVEPVQIEVTPVGRFVSGSTCEPDTKDFKGNPLKNKDGTARVEFFIGLAFRKTDQAFNDLYSKMVLAGMHGFPSMFPNGVCNNPKFNFKLIDGDGLDGQGQPYSDREGYAGCWVLKFKSGFAPKCFSRLDNPSAPVQEIMANRIKRGDYIRVSGSAVANMDTDYPGIYLNCYSVELVGYGKEIKGGSDGAVAFAEPAALPAGASAVPTASTAGIPAGPPAPPMGMPQAAPVMPQPSVMPQAAPVMPQPAAMPQAAPVMPQPATVPHVAPAPEILGGTVPPPPLGTPTMTAKAGATTYDQFIASGWTKEQLVAHGYMDEPPF